MCAFHAVSIRAQVADFGTAYDGVDRTNADGRTHDSTRTVAGTEGYMPPEYASTGHVSEKTDAYGTAPRALHAAEPRGAEKPRTSMILRGGVCSEKSCAINDYSEMIILMIVMRF